MTLDQQDLVATRVNWAGLLDDTLPRDPTYPPSRPVRRGIVAVDIEGSTLRTDPAKGVLRQVMYELVEYALSVSGIHDRHCEPLIDRGDGILALIRPVDEVPITALLDTMIPTLSRSVARHNERHPHCALRLRAVVHSGEVHHDRRGCFGVALDHAFRLLDAPELKLRLRQAPGNSLALVVSEDIYWSVVAQGYEGIDEHDFERAVRVSAAGHAKCGWVSLPRC